MIISIDYKSGKGSVYRCDMCQKKFNTYSINRVFVSEKGDKVKLKKWDLCDVCYQHVAGYVSTVRERIIKRKREQK